MTTPAIHTEQRQAGPTRGLVLASLAGPLLAGGGIAALFSARDELPAQIAVHWGIDGRADRFASFDETWLTASLITVLVPLVLVIMASVMHPSVRATLSGIAGCLAVMLGLITFGSAFAQRGHADGHGADALPGLWLGVGLVTGVLVGLLIWRVGRWTPPPVPPRRAPLPADAPRLDVSSTTRLAWTGRAALSRPAMTILSVLTLAPMVALAVIGEPWVWLIVFAIAALILITLSARVVVDASGLRVSSLGLTWSRVPLERITSATTAAVSPLRDFGGWGWRIGRDGRRGYVTRAGVALVVHRSGEPDVLVTIDGADEAAAVLNTLASRVG